MDVITLVTGDTDYVPLLWAIKRRGVRTAVFTLAFEEEDCCKKHYFATPGFQMVALIEKIASSVKNELIYGAHLTAIGGPSLILAVSLLTRMDVALAGLAITYLIPLIVYSLNYNAEVGTDHITDQDRVRYVTGRRRWFPYLLALYALVLALLLVQIGNAYLSIFGLVALSGGVLYSYVFKILTKKVIGFKSFFVSAIWAYASTLFLPFYHQVKLNGSYPIIFGFIFLKILVNVVFFDIKDIDSDSQKMLRTLPIILGRDKALTALQVVNLSAYILLFLGVFLGYLPVFSLSLSIFYFYSAYYLHKGRTADSKRLLGYSYVMADAEFVLWPVVLFLGKALFSIFLH